MNRWALEASRMPKLLQHRSYYTVSHAVAATQIRILPDTYQKFVTEDCIRDCL